MERFDKETLIAMSKDELIETVETLQLKLETNEKEIEKLKAEAEIGRKYLEHLRTEAEKLIRLVDGENTALLKLIEKADVDTLKSLVDEYTEKAKDKYKPSAKTPSSKEEEHITRETLEKADYATLVKLSEKFRKGELTTITTQKG